MSVLWWEVGQECDLECFVDFAERKEMNLQCKVLY